MRFERKHDDVSVVWLSPYISLLAGTGDSASETDTVNSILHPAIIPPLFCVIQRSITLPVIVIDLKTVEKLGRCRGRDTASGPHTVRSTLQLKIIGLSLAYCMD